MRKIMLILGPFDRAAQIRRTISLASVDSLLKVAQDERMREQFLVNVKEQGRRMVWRDEREAKKLPGDAERALVLAIKRGLSECRDNAKERKAHVIHRIVCTLFCNQGRRKPPANTDTNSPKRVRNSSLSDSTENRYCIPLTAVSGGH